MKKRKKFFLAYQERWLEDDARIKIWEKSRRIGATYVQSYEDVRDAALGRVPAVWFSSADESAAKEYIFYVEKWAKILNFAAENLGEIVLDSEKDVKALAVKFANGVRINALTSNPKRFRSKEGKIILDEFAWHNNPEEMWRAARPCITWGFPLRILSTHNGKGVLFYKFTEKIKKGSLKWSLHITDIYTAVAEGLVKKIWELSGRGVPTAEDEADWLRQEREDCADDITWKQEYCCEAVDEATAFLSYEMIGKCERDNILYVPLTKIKDMVYTEKEVKDKEIPTGSAAGKIFYDREVKKLIEPLQETISGSLFLGFDIARRKNLSVLWVVEKIGWIKYTRAVMAMENCGFSVQEAVLFIFLSHPKTVRGCIDQNGMGENLTENAWKKFGKFKAEGVIPNNSIKAELATNLYLAFEDISFLIPMDEKIKEDYHSIRKFTAATGKPRFDTASSGKRGKQGESHADYFWAGALANAAAQETEMDNSIKSKSIRKRDKISQRYSSFSVRDIEGIY